MSIKDFANKVSSEMLKGRQNVELEQELTEALNASISNLAQRYDAILNREKRKSKSTKMLDAQDGHDADN